MAWPRPNASAMTTMRQESGACSSEKRLRNGTQKLAESLGVDPALLASRRDLEQVALGDRPARLDGWRDEVLDPLIG